MEFNRGQFTSLAWEALEGGDVRKLHGIYDEARTSVSEDSYGSGVVDSWGAIAHYILFRESGDASSGAAAQKLAESARQNLLADPIRNRFELQYVRRVLNGTSTDVQINLPPNSPGVMGIARQFIELCRSTGADSALAIQSGFVIGSFTAPCSAFPSPVMSTTKSIIGLAAYVLAQQNKFELDAPAYRFLDEAQITAPIDVPLPSFKYQKILPQTRWDCGERQHITIRHLLNQTAGIVGNSYFLDRKLGEQWSLHTNSDIGAAAQPLEGSPAGRQAPSVTCENFRYSNPATQLLSRIVSNAADKSINEILRETVLAPLSMDHTESIQDPDTGSVDCVGEIWSTPQDLASFGKELLRLISGRGLLTAEWSRQYLTPSSAHFAGGSPNYGNLLWFREQWKGVQTSGYLGNDVYALPEHDLVLVRMQRLPPSPPSYFERVSAILSQ